METHHGHQAVVAADCAGGADGDGSPAIGGYIMVLIPLLITFSKQLNFQNKITDH